MPEVVIEEARSAETDAFFTEQWRPHDARVGVVWDGSEHRLAARVQSDLVGAAYFSVAGGVGELKQILVREDHGGAGIGSRLLAAFESRCRELGCHKLRLETAEYQARGFYERHGYSALHTFDDDRFYRCWYLMEKRLVVEGGSHGSD